ncbi:MAG: hypothetical protein COT14_00895 [Candidatus Diapherotrites archaeon CG08_land_8_20_14_0_20_30_16]|nr:MAG: hypothetical protein COT14_00895 [Candidatus Diapherotrites archaeon CG08_land_8_20_14_0_20_30_16]
MAKKDKEIAQERKIELLSILKKTKDETLKNNCVKQIALLSERFNLRRTKEEKDLYCKYCRTVYSNKTKTRIKHIKKNKKKILKKIIICGNCGKDQKQTL